jgi:hypothetical protein
MAIDWNQRYYGGEHLAMAGQHGVAVLDNVRQVVRLATDGLTPKELALLQKKCSELDDVLLVIRRLGWRLQETSRERVRGERFSAGGPQKALTGKKAPRK